MGNSNRKRENSSISVQKTNHVNRERFHHYFSQLSLSNIANNLSGRSFLSVASHQSNYSVSRPWSRISRRRWKESTLNEPFEASKTAWPVANIEAAFLPEFSINTELTERSFRILELISHGAYGKVYKVQKLDTQQLYALKILSKAQVIHENAVRQVKEEVAIQKVCGHNPFIVGCPFHWQSHRRLYIVSEYIDGGELFHLLEQYGSLPEYLVAVYVAEIALGLDFLHNAGIIYRDLKPENILLDQENGHIHLIDFGLSKWLKYGDRTTTLCGTLRYMAPEVASLKPYGHAADWWSLGVLACRMLLDEYPVPAIPRLEECQNPTVQQQPSPDKPPGTLPECATTILSRHACQLLYRLLDREPHRRLRSLLTLQHEGIFKDIVFGDIKSRKISPKQILNQYFPNGPPIKHSQQKDPNNLDLFDTFTSNSIIV